MLSYFKALVKTSAEIIIIIKHISLTANQLFALKLFNQFITWLGGGIAEISIKTERQSFSVLTTPHLFLLAADNNRWSSQQELQLKSKSTCLLVIAFSASTLCVKLLPNLKTSHNHVWLLDLFPIFTLVI